MSEQRRYVVRGKVQGVGFRYFARREAEFLSLGGSVRNREDGTVEIFAEGPPETLDSFGRRLRQGPPAGSVTSCESEPAAFEPADGQFQILF